MHASLEECKGTVTTYREAGGADMQIMILVLMPIACVTVIVRILMAFARP